jgi:hypothetical protein
LTTDEKKTSCLATGVSFWILYSGKGVENIKVYLLNSRKAYLKERVGYT